MSVAQFYDKAKVDNLLSNKQDTISDLDTIRSSAILTPVYSATPTFSEWTVEPPTYEGERLVPVFGAVSYPIGWSLCKASNLESSILTPLDGDKNATYLHWIDSEILEFTATRTRTDIIGYKLGGQIDKPLAPAKDYALKSDIPAVVAPSTDASVAGKAADAKVTGDTLETIQFKEWFPGGEAKFIADCTPDLKYDWGNADETNHTVEVLPFCDTGDSAMNNSDKSGRVVVPPYVDHDGVRYTVVGVASGKIGDGNGDLTDIVAPTTVTSIRSGAFNTCTALTTVSLPAATTISDGVLLGCSALTSVSLPAAMEVGFEAFGDCTALTSVSLPAVTSISDEAFLGCTSLAFVDFGPDARQFVPSLGTGAFPDLSQSGHICKIVVPDVQYDDWTADSWRNLTSKGYEFVKWSSTQPVPRGDVEAALNRKLDKVGGAVSGDLNVNGTIYTANRLEVGSNSDINLNRKYGENAIQKGDVILTFPNGSGEIALSKNIPSVPVKEVQVNEVVLTPDASGTVNVEVPVVDDSLSKTGAAADAKKTGTITTRLTNNVNSLFSLVGTRLSRDEAVSGFTAWVLTEPDPYVASEFSYDSTTRTLSFQLFDVDTGDAYECAFSDVAEDATTVTGVPTGDFSGTVTLTRTRLRPTAAQEEEWTHKVWEYANLSVFPATGTENRVYVDKSTNLTYRWDVTSRSYVQIGGSSVTVDDAIDATSTNPVQNGAIATALSGKANSAALATPFDSSKAYPANSYVTHDGLMYKCASSVAAGEWNVANWTLVDLMTPDATFDVLADGRLRIADASGNELWSQGYNLASGSATALSCDKVNYFEFVATNYAAFSKSETYAVDAVVVYNGKVYTCTTAVDTAGAWTGSTNWTETLVSQEFTLPKAGNGKVGDFILDVSNEVNPLHEVHISISGTLGTDYDAIVPRGESLAAILTVPAGGLAEFYFTMTAFGTAAKPAWKVVRQLVEKEEAQS